jgi:excisionase family DNA binding protein
MGRFCSRQFDDRRLGFDRLTHRKTYIGGKFLLDRTRGSGVECEPSAAHGVTERERMEMLTTNQVAAALNTSPDTVLLLIKTGELRSEQIRNRSPHRIPKSELLAFAQRRRLTLRLEAIGDNQ